MCTYSIVTSTTILYKTLVVSFLLVTSKRALNVFWFPITNCEIFAIISVRINISRVGIRVDGSSGMALSFGESQVMDHGILNNERFYSDLIDSIDEAD